MRFRTEPGQDTERTSLGSCAQLMYVLAKVLEHAPSFSYGVPDRILISLVYFLLHTLNHCASIIMLQSSTCYYAGARPFWRDAFDLQKMTHTPIMRHEGVR